MVLTHSWSLRTVNVQRQVTLFLRRTVIVEHHPVRTQFLGDLIVHASVVFVALRSVREETVGLRALALQLFTVVIGDWLSRPDRRGRRPFSATVGLAAQQSDCGNDLFIKPDA